MSWTFVGLNPMSMKWYPMAARALAPGLALLALALAAAPAEAQIPTSPRGRPTGQAPARPRPQADTVPKDSAARREVVQDSVIDQLLKLEGYVPVEYQADSAEFRNAERTLRLRGNAVVNRQGTELTATDSIVYRELSDFVEIYGKPHVTGEGQDITGDVIYYDLAAERASVRGAKTTIDEGATWYVQGNVTSEEQGARVYGTSSTFTSDEREEPAYHFKVDRMKVIRNRVLIGRPAYLYFRNVPVFILPFIVQDLAKGRRSGVLIPEFEITDIVRTDAPGRGERGTGRHIGNIGYYWALSEYTGAQVSFDWRSQSWMSLTGGYQYTNRRRFMNADLSFQRFWREQGANSINLRGGGNWQPNERTTLNTALNYASSTEFERNRSIDPLRQTSEISSTFSLTRRADWGQISSGAELRQDIATGDSRLGSRLSISPQTVTIFPAGEGTLRWYNDASLTLTGDVNYDRNTRDQAYERRLANDARAGANLTGNVRIGPIAVGGGLRYSRDDRESLASIDSLLVDPAPGGGGLGFLPGLRNETLDWSASTGYEFRLIGATRLTPNISLGQQVVRRDSIIHPDSVLSVEKQQAFGRFIAGTPRVNFGAGLQTELFGFFPGFGQYSAIRHHITPGLRYTYSPQVPQNDLQRAVFGEQGGREQNEVTLQFDQTFEAKVRRPAQSERNEQIARAGTGNPSDAGAGNPGAQTDTLGLPAAPGNPAAAVPDSAGGRPGVSGDAPDQDRKVTLLAINTSALAYNFAPRPDRSLIPAPGTPRTQETPFYRFQTDDLSSTLRSDLFGGLNITLAHDLFEEERAGSGTTVGTRRGRFSPFLTQLGTQVSFGANSALFRWLGFARADEGERRTERGNTPPEEGVAPVDPPGSQTATGQELTTGTGGAGPWNVSVGYSLQRQRPSPLDDVPRRSLSGDNQNLRLNVTFYPTRNWAVNWNTQYSITENEFAMQVLNLKRDLYRWQANFDIVRAPNGNTSFSFSAHLTDLPDLKADYRRQNLGGNRTEGTTRPRTP
jgi:hypothetical protein